MFPIRYTDPSRHTGNCCCRLETHSTSLPNTRLPSLSSRVNPIDDSYCYLSTLSTIMSSCCWLVYRQGLHLLHSFVNALPYRRCRHLFLACRSNRQLSHVDPIDVHVSFFFPGGSELPPIFFSCWRASELKPLLLVLSQRQCHGELPSSNHLRRSNRRSASSFPSACSRSLHRLALETLIVLSGDDPLYSNPRCFDLYSTW